MNLYRPSNNLTGNATYNCSIAAPGGPEAILTWEVGKVQIITSKQFMDFADQGIYIDPWPTNNTVVVTTLVVSEQAWQPNEKAIPVQCVARRGFLRNNVKIPPVPYYVRFYGESECCWRCELLSAEKQLNKDSL
jgi:hypothetical protein